MEAAISPSGPPYAKCLSSVGTATIYSNQIKQILGTEVFLCAFYIYSKPYCTLQEVTYIFSFTIPSVLLGEVWYNTIERLKLIKEEIEDRGVPVNIREHERALCELYIDNTNDTIIYHDITTPQNYLELVTGKVYNLKSNDKKSEIEDNLEEEGFSELWNFSLDEITEVIATETSVVLVELCDINKDEKIISMVPGS